MATLPPLLRKGDAVRLVAPSGPFDRDRFAAGVACLEHAGLVPIYDDGLFARQGYLAGSDARRAAELCAAMADESAAALWLARGGYGATRILPAVAPSLARSRPKWLVGFSDATALHALWQRQGWASLHGPNMTTLAGWGAAARRDLWAWLLQGAGPVLSGRTLRGRGQLQAEVTGGNLTVLAAMAGGGFLPSWVGRIVLLEDVGERPYRLDRALTTLAQAGALQGVAAFVIGQLTDCDAPAGDGALAVIVEVLAQLAPEVPILAELAVGHEPSSQALPLGVPATLDLDGGELRVHAIDQAG